MAHFKRVTSTPPRTGLINAVIMGRKTWESIPPKFRPLDNRTNVILSRSKNTVSLSPKGQNENVLFCTSLQEAIETLKKLDCVGNIFVIGGGEVYKESIESGLVDRVIYTEVSNLPPDTQFDTWFPTLDTDEWECHPFPGQEVMQQGEQSEEKKNGEDLDARANTLKHMDEKTHVQYQFLEYTRRKSSKRLKVDSDRQHDVSREEVMEQVQEGPQVNPEEMQYLELCRDIIEIGIKRGDRTGTGTLSKFGAQMRFSLRDGTLPLLTTKRTFWRGVAEELLWFIQVRRYVSLFPCESVHFNHNHHLSLQGKHQCQ
jgi:dihydrofolate reductase/thymidylate synthase